MICPECGKSVERFYSGTCQSCYNYFRHGGTKNVPPDPGRIAYDINGKVVCHICGRAFTRLGSHVKESHGMTAAEYKNKFGLCNCTKLTEESYQQTMRQYTDKYNMRERLLKSGESTRIKRGETGKRAGKKAALQEILDKRDRALNKLCKDR